MNPPDEKIVELVKKAQLGCQESMRELAELSEGRVRAYLYRVTLDNHLAEDLLQETMLQMVKSLKDLVKPQSFWPWLYRVAMGKAQHHFRANAKHGRVIRLEESQLEAVCGGHSNGNGLENTIRGELAHAIFDGIEGMKFRYRNVLVLRCFEQKQYAEIAQIMDCSRTTAQVWFFRAKQILKKKLVKQGFSKAMMLTGLCLFGKMTAPAKAAFATCTVAGESTKIGLAATVVGVLTSRLGILITAIILAGGAGGVLSLTAGRDDGQSAGPGLPDISAVRSFHFVEQAWSNVGQANPNLSRGRSLSKGAYEQWFYFPQGVEGAMFMMMQRWDPQMKSRLCSWMQNSKGNYYYHSGSQTIYINNYHLPLRDLRTRRLPTDSAEFTSFLDNIEGNTKGISYERDAETGLLTGALDNRFYNAADFHSSISYNELTETDFESFRYSWPQDAHVVDERDAMHKRGWTYFKVRGEIGKRQIYGRGKIPFTYEKYADFTPWVELEFDNEYIITDMEGQCRASNTNGQVLATYRPGIFLKGLSRPWMGMHTIDLIRREAARQRIRFETKKLGNDWDKVLVTLIFQDEDDTVTAVYRVNLDKDLIERIELRSTDSAGQATEGYLAFEYVDDVEAEHYNFSAPSLVRIPRRTRHRGDLGIGWLFELARGSLLQ
jgi:RNA polymerase sigma-70 factor (ECF subfamily)